MKNLDEQFMRVAIQEAKKGDFPFGAVIVKNNKIIAKAHNKVGKNDPTAHAEIMAIRKACKKLNSRHLAGCVLYSTCEPCPMCFTAIWWAKISKLVYGAEGESVTEDDWRIDLKCYEINKRAGNKLKIIGGFLKDECLKLFK